MTSFGLINLQDADLLLFEGDTIFKWSDVTDNHKRMTSLALNYEFFIVGEGH